jgi:hypothetical protein
MLVIGFEGTAPNENGVILVGKAAKQVGDRRKWHGRMPYLCMLPGKQVNYMHIILLIRRISGVPACHLGVLNSYRAV